MYIGRSCPDCHSSLSTNAMQCACGWGQAKVIQKGEKRVPLIVTCEHLENGSICRSTTDVRATYEKNNRMYLCEKHFLERNKNARTKLVDEQAELDKSECERLGKSGYQLAIERLKKLGMRNTVQHFESKETV